MIAESDHATALQAIGRLASMRPRSDDRGKALNMSGCTGGQFGFNEAAI